MDLAAILELIKKGDLDAALAEIQVLPAEVDVNQKVGEVSLLEQTFLALQAAYKVDRLEGIHKALKIVWALFVKGADFNQPFTLDFEALKARGIERDNMDEKAVLLRSDSQPEEAYHGMAWNNGAQEILRCLSEHPNMEGIPEDAADQITLSILQQIPNQPIANSGKLIKPYKGYGVQEDEAEAGMHAQSAHNVALHRQVGNVFRALQGRYPDIKVQAEIIDLFHALVDFKQRHPQSKYSPSYMDAVIRFLATRARAKDIANDGVTDNSLTEFLALTWHACKQNSDGEKLLEKPLTEQEKDERLVALSEIVITIIRGYNPEVYEEGGDNVFGMAIRQFPHTPDDLACGPGSYTKLLSMLQGMHPDFPLKQQPPQEKDLVDLVNDVMLEVFNNHVGYESQKIIHQAIKDDTYDDTQVFSYLSIEGHGENLTFEVDENKLEALKAEPELTKQLVHFFQSVGQVFINQVVAKYGIKEQKDQDTPSAFIEHVKTSLSENVLAYTNTKLKAVDSQNIRPNAVNVLRQLEYENEYESGQSKYIDLVKSLEGQDLIAEDEAGMSILNYVIETENLEYLRVIVPKLRLDQIMMERADRSSVFWQLVHNKNIEKLDVANFIANFPTEQFMAPFGGRPSYFSQLLLEISEVNIDIELRHDLEEVLEYYLTNHVPKEQLSKFLIDGLPRDWYGLDKLIFSKLTAEDLPQAMVTEENLAEAVLQDNINLVRLLLQRQVGGIEEAFKVSLKYHRPNTAQLFSDLTDLSFILTHSDAWTKRLVNHRDPALIKTIFERFPQLMVQDASIFQEAYSTNDINPVAPIFDRINPETRMKVIKSILSGASERTHYKDTTWLKGLMQGHYHELELENLTAPEILTLFKTNPDLALLKELEKNPYKLEEVITYNPQRSNLMKTLHAQKDLDPKIIDYLIENHGSLLKKFRDQRDFSVLMATFNPSQIIKLLPLYSAEELRALKEHDGFENVMKSWRSEEVAQVIDLYGAHAFLQTFPQLAGYVEQRGYQACIKKLVGFRAFESEIDLQLYSDQEGSFDKLASQLDHQSISDVQAMIKVVLNSDYKSKETPSIAYFNAALILNHLLNHPKGADLPSSLLQQVLAFLITASPYSKAKVPEVLYAKGTALRCEATDELMKVMQSTGADDLNVYVFDVGVELFFRQGYGKEFDDTKSEVFVDNLLDKENMERFLKQFKEHKSYDLINRMMPQLALKTLHDTTLLKEAWPYLTNETILELMDKHGVEAIRIEVGDDEAITRQIIKHGFDASRDRFNEYLNAKVKALENLIECYAKPETLKMAYQEIRSERLNQSWSLTRAFKTASSSVLGVDATRERQLESLAQAFQSLTEASVSTFEQKIAIVLSELNDIITEAQTYTVGTHQSMIQFCQNLQQEFIKQNKMAFPEQDKTSQVDIKAFLGKHKEAIEQFKRGDPSALPKPKMDG